MAEPSTRTVERALALLATICERGGANLADSARDCDLAPSTALRLLRTLETTGFVSREEAGGTYRPGARLIQLGAQALVQRVADRSRQADDGEARRRNGRVGVPQRRRARRDRPVHRDRRGHTLRPAHQLGRSNGAARQIGGGPSASRSRSPMSDTSWSSVESRPTSRRSRARCTREARIVAAMSLVDSELPAHQRTGRAIRPDAGARRRRMSPPS